MLINNVLNYVSTLNAVDLRQLNNATSIHSVDNSSNELIKQTYRDAIPYDASNAHDMAYSFYARRASKTTEESIYSQVARLWVSAELTNLLIATPINPPLWHRNEEQIGSL